MSQNKNTIDILQEIALINVYSDTSTYEYFYRKNCRDYSRMFFTSLPEVYKIPFHEILLNLYETNFEDILSGENGKEELNNMAIKVLDPVFDKRAEADLEAFVKKFAQKKDPQKETKKVFNEPPPPEVSNNNSDGLDSLVSGIGQED